MIEIVHSKLESLALALASNGNALNDFVDDTLKNSDFDEKELALAKEILIKKILCGVEVRLTNMFKFKHNRPSNHPDTDDLVYHVNLNLKLVQVKMLLPVLSACMESDYLRECVIGASISSERYIQIRDYVYTQETRI